MERQEGTEWNVEGKTNLPAKLSESVDHILKTNVSLESSASVQENKIFDQRG